MFNFVKVKESRVADFAWRRLTRYQDVDATTDRVMKLKDLDGRHKKNVRKQAQQLAFSLTQSKEFFRSAEMTGPTTRALQAYYAVTSAVNAEILWKGDGNVSFDQRHGNFNSHGFRLREADDVLNFAALPSKVGEAPGLFGLWRKFAVQLPHHGTVERVFADGFSQSSVEQLSTSIPLSDIEMPYKHITLLDCLRHLPHARDTLASYGHATKLVRGAVRKEERYDGAKKCVSCDVIHSLYPYYPEILEDVADRFSYAAEHFPDLNLTVTNGGLITRFNLLSESQKIFHAAEAFSETKNQLLFLGSGHYLNELGYYYVALYIAGMVTRYHPDRWIRAIKQSSPATTLIDELVDHAIMRVPCLLLAAIDNTVALID